MRRLTLCVGLLALAFTPALTLALSPGTDILVPAAARGEGLAGSTWVTDVYVFNPGTESASLTLYWLVRGQANPSPDSRDFTLAGGQTLVLEDIVSETFGLETANGALRVVSDHEVVVNSRIFNDKQGVTFGQGFEGLLRSQAVAAGGSTDVVGLANNATFRTNLVLIDASGSGSTVALSVRDTAGTELASGSYTLGAFEPRLFAITNLDASLLFDAATLHAEVESGSAIIAASKIDNDTATGDPTTLEPWIAAGGGLASVDGTYQIAIYDSAQFASGGNVVIAGGEMTQLNGTYTNWDKGDPANPDCTLIFRFGGTFPEPVPLDDLAAGIVFSTTYVDSGTMTYTVTFEVEDNLSIAGTVVAEGSGFAGQDVGCNGSFPSLTLRGGRSN